MIPRPRQECVSRSTWNGIGKSTLGSRDIMDRSKGGRGPGIQYRTRIQSPSLAGRHAAGSLKTRIADMVPGQKICLRVGLVRVGLKTGNGFARLGSPVEEFL